VISWLFLADITAIFLLAVMLEPEPEIMVLLHMLVSRWLLSDNSQQTASMPAVPQDNSQRRSFIDSTMRKS